MKYLIKINILFSSLLLPIYHPVVTAQTIDVIDPVRVMAAQCAQCHGMEGNNTEGFEHLNGESYNEIYEELLEMRNSNENELMHRQAKGYTNRQIRALATYFASQPRSENDDFTDDERSDR